MKFQPFKLAASVLVFFALSALGYAQDSLSGTLYSYTFSGGSGSTTGAFYFGSGATSGIDYTALETRYQPGSFLGRYSLEVTISAQASVGYWFDVKGDPVFTPFLTASYWNAAAPKVLGSESFGSNVVKTYSTEFAAADVTSGTTVAFNYGDISLERGDSLALTATYKLTAIPEPSTYALIFGACTLGLVGWRRFRK